MLKLSFRLYKNLGNRLIEAPECYDGITLFDGDLLVYELDKTIYTLKAKNSGFYPQNELPNVLYELAEFSLSLGKIQIIDKRLNPTIWTVRPFKPVNQVGLCPCGLSAINGLVPGDIIQNWCGEIFQYTLEGGVRHVVDGWTPGKDCVLAQKSRFWEN